MADLKYADYIVSDAKPELPLMLKQLEEERHQGRSTVEFTHLMSVDRERIKDFFYVDCSWLWTGSTQGMVEEPHTHDFDEVMGFVGCSREDPHDLGGEITIWLDGDRRVFNKSCLIYIPAGVNHCPIQFNRIERPVFHVNIAPTGSYRRNAAEPMAEKSAGTAAPRYSIVTETKAKFSVAPSGEKMPPPPPRDPSLRSTRILHLEDDIARGSFYVDFVWIWEGNGGAPATEHSHDWVELIAMAGADREHPRDLGGAMSIALDGETHMMTHSSLVCIPKGLKHCPWKFIGIKKPTLVFTAGPSGMYSGTHKQQW